MKRTAGSLKCVYVCKYVNIELVVTNNGKYYKTKIYQFEKKKSVFLSS